MKPTPKSRAASPAPKSRAAKPAPKSRAARPAPKRRAAQPAPRSRAAKLTPKSRAAKPTPKSRAAQPAPTRRTAKPTPKAAARRASPALKLVRKSPPGAKRRVPAVPTAFPQRGGATAKQLLLFELVRAWARVLAALQGLPAAAAARPVSGSRWTVRDIVLHLHAWDLEWERALEPAFRGVRPTWLDLGAPELARMNEALLAPLRQLPWDEAVRRLHASRSRLMEAIESLPEEPAASWTQEHPLGELLATLPEHDRHHAEVIKRARAEAPPQPRTP